MPYENGYEIYIDGEKSDYISYRGSLILVKVSEGIHDIEIKYIAPGIRSGLVISIVSLIVTGVYVLINYNGKRKGKKSIE